MSNSDNRSYAKIMLDLGGSLQKLSLENKAIIKDLSPLSYDTTFASAILFPFSNRIKDSTYTFKQKKYTLDANSKEENNAIHGLIYNKKFSLDHQETSSDFAKITLSYKELQKTNGFPYTYTIVLTYTLTKSSLNLSLTIKNDDNEAFPFNVGWHPYFHSSDLYNSKLSLQSDQKLLFNKEMIPVKIESIKPITAFKIEDLKFDDCFILNNNIVSFKTPDYQIEILASAKENYLQIFTPNKKNTIALEPITGPGNSFNNKLGLQILNSNETYSVSWEVKKTNHE